MRIVRCADTPVNSVFAAGAASYILVSSHSAFLRASLFGAEMQTADPCTMSAPAGRSYHILLGKSRL